MEAGTCGYRKWDVTGILCAHAIFAILHQGGEPNEYLSEYYGKEMYLTYNHVIYPVPSAANQRLSHRRLRQLLADLRKWEKGVLMNLEILVQLGRG